MTMRFRSRGAFSSPIIPYTAKQYASLANSCSASSTYGWTSLPSGTGQDFVGERQTMSDLVVKDFHKRRAAGEVFFNPMDRTTTTLNPAEFGGSLSYKENFWQCGETSPYRYQKQYELGPAVCLQFLSPVFEPNWATQTWSPPPLLSDRELETALNEASTLLLAKRGQPDSNLWESLAERKQSYQLLGSYLKSADRAVRGMEKATSGSRHSVWGLGDIARAGFDAHLMTRYGLTPLVKDIAMVRAGWSKPTGNFRQTVRGGSVVGTSSTSVSTAPYGSVRFSITDLISDEFSVRAMSLDEWNVSTLENYGLSAKGLLGVPYDLLTLSFVADWFTNLGDYLKAYIPAFGCNQLGSCIVYTRTRARTRYVQSVSPVGIAVVNSSPSGMKTGVRVEKVRVPGLRSPSLVLRNNFGLDPSLQKDHVRIADAAALIGQRLLRVANALRFARVDTRTYTE